VDWIVAWYVLAALLVIAGVVFTVIPPLPGVFMVLGGLFVAAWADKFEYVGAITLMLMAFIAVLSYIVDLTASALGAKKTGASAQAIWGAAFGALVGIFFGIPGDWDGTGQRDQAGAGIPDDRNVCADAVYLKIFGVRVKTGQFLL
jgi:uncharacterized protein YqgC (DUF456 family)